MHTGADTRTHTHARTYIGTGPQARVGGLRGDEDVEGRGARAGRQQLNAHRQALTLRAWTTQPITTRTERERM
jgi:hypothetical protein